MTNKAEKNFIINKITISIVLIKKQYILKKIAKVRPRYYKIIDKRKTAEERLKKLNIIAYFNNIKNKIKLKFSIFKEKQIIKKDVIKQLYSKSRLIEL